MSDTPLAPSPAPLSSAPVPPAPAPPAPLLSGPVLSAPLLSAPLLSARIIDWFASSGRALPWREPGFPAWGILVSEFMLQQTPVARVIPRLAEWLERWPTPGALASVPPGEAVRAWANLGYPRRALWLHAAAVTITERHDGVVPQGVDDLLALPGVGDYTARAVSVFAYGHRHPVVDTNTRRVIARAIDGNQEPAPPSNSRDLAAMDRLLPESVEDARVFNAGAMELGAIVCTARAPKCGECPIADACAWRLAGYPAYEGKRKAVQKKYEGSDRHVRGLIMAELRAAHVPVTRAEIDSLWPDAVQRERALAGLVADGLAVNAETGYVLP
ncbi:A/G-specific adenine glycosylase [Mycetocola zhujimingii]|uniref:Adenine DNA glycosylase n=1 Tax=Mycetocola zhujimingii TaxID=2079792 RepID=A0A2U1TEG7_9MICO|nr:A/G-specific adenine glycosylase [Mycetocola zhujimingii]PWC07282.1 adenine glycosylase [Mycetocola zhujimingii]